MSATLPARDDELVDPATSGPRRGFKNTRVMWGTASSMIAFHVLALGGIVYLALNFNWWTLGLGVVWYLLCGLSITAGYHRLFAHRSYRASPVLRALYLAFGAAAMQRSAMIWATDHRIHHKQTDKESDPYSVKHGFWWAHFGWVVSDAALRNEGRPVPQDLSDDVLVRLQDRYWLPIAIFFSMVLPMAIGFAWGDPIGALLVAGFLRLTITWHATFSVNSFAHRFGAKTYSAAESARDNFWIALATLGEGYHNFHHRFQTDYRNGVKWFHYDPTKWLIWTMSRLGLSRGLVKLPKRVIDAARTGTGR